MPKRGCGPKGRTSTANRIAIAAVCQPEAARPQQRELFIDEFLRRLREAPPGTRIYMRVGDVFKDADVVSLDELPAARDAAVARDDADDGEEPGR